MTRYAAVRSGLLVAGGLLAGCVAPPSEAGFNRTMATSIGKPEAAVIRTLGVPDKIYEAGGVRYLSYRQQNLSGGRTYTCDITIELVGGFVRDWSAKGNACRS